MRTWKLEIEYDGTRYAGWQRQPQMRTVQGELTKAAEQFFDKRVDLGGSGRTDAGVHALRQVAHLRAPVRSLPERQLEYGLNDLLPHDIHVLRATQARPDFHARHDAVARFYLYQISTRRTAFAKPYVWWIKDELDLNAMTVACELFVGRHDFRYFCDAAEGQTSTVVEVFTAGLQAEGDLILFRVGAGRFLWKMVRRLIGTLVEVGRRRMKPTEVGQMLVNHSREPARLTAPPSGLFLERVLYRGEAPPTWPPQPAFNVGQATEE